MFDKACQRAVRGRGSFVYVARGVPVDKLEAGRRLSSAPGAELKTFSSAFLVAAHAMRAEGEFDQRAARVRLTEQVQNPY